MTGATRLWVTCVTAFRPDVAHAVTDAEVAARNATHRGEYRAVCGAEFLPGELSLGQRCPTCQRYVRARGRSPDLGVRSPGDGRCQGRQAKQGWWHRWWSVRQQGNNND
jgi:hypothetical protein